MPINERGVGFGIEGAAAAEKQAPESSEKPVVDYESAATNLERGAFDALERLVKGIDLLPEYAEQGRELLVKAREDIEKETKEFLRQLRETLDITPPNNRPDRYAPPLELRIDETDKPRAGDNLRFSLDHDIIGPNYVDAYNGYMFDAVKEKYIKAQDAYRNGDKKLGDILMNNTEGMAWVIIHSLELCINKSRGFEWSKKRPEDIFDIIKIEMQEDFQRHNPSNSFSKN